MRKIFYFLLLLCLLHNNSFSQKNVSASTVQVSVDEELKAVLTSKLSLSDEVAGKVTIIEKEFHTQLAAIAALGEIPLKDKEIKLNAAHVARRKNLIAIPLSPRQMEDVVTVSDRVYRSHPM